VSRKPVASDRVRRRDGHVGSRLKSGPQSSVRLHGWALLLAALACFFALGACDGQTGGGGGFEVSLVKPKAPEAPMQAYVQAVDFVDATHGWVIGNWTIDGNIVRPLVWRTTDGRTWKAVEIPLHESPDAVDFIDPRHGWIVTTGSEAAVEGPGVAILHTTDGGLTWDITRNADLIMLESAHGPLFFSDVSHGWVVGVARRDNRSVVLSTDDGGVTWRNVPVSEQPVTLTSVAFADAEHGWISGFFNQRYGAPGAAFQSSDGGRTWRLAASGSSPASGLFRLDSTHLWSMTWPHQLLGLDSQGAGWKPIGGREAGPDLFAFATPTVGWGIRFDRGEEERVVGWHLLRTADAGETWKDCHVDLPDEPVDLTCPTSDSVVVVTQSGTIATVSENGDTAP